MKRPIRILAWWIGALAAGVALVLFFLQGRGVSAQAEPSWVEQRAALFLRSWLTPARSRGLLNPVSASPTGLAEAMEHFADHCSTCHANDGSGNTEIGKSLYPKAPDMRLARTQELTDGELFYFIEHGIRFTGMPGWSTGTPEGEKASWQMVHFIRHLPAMTPEEVQGMERFNPRSPADIDSEREIEAFLNGDTPPPTKADDHSTHGVKRD